MAPATFALVARMFRTSRTRILRLRLAKPRHLRMATIKPLDRAAIVKAASECGAIVTAEEHQITAGLGGAVAEVLAQEYPAPVEFVGVKDTFGGSGKPDELMEFFGLTSKDVKAAVKRAIARKK